MWQFLLRADISAEDNTKVLQPEWLQVPPLTPIRIPLVTASRLTTASFRMPEWESKRDTSMMENSKFILDCLLCIHLKIKVVRSYIKQGAFSRQLWWPKALHVLLKWILCCRFNQWKHLLVSKKYTTRHTRAKRNVCKRVWFEGRIEVAFCYTCLHAA